MAFTVFYGDWEAISIAAAALSVIGSIMLLMLSRLFGLRNLEQTAKAEFIFAASTVLIVMMVLGLVKFGEAYLASDVVRCMYLSSFGCDCTQTAVFQQQTLIDWMKLYMDTSTACVQGFMNVLYWLSVPIEGCSSIYMEIFMSEHASGFMCKPIAERISNTTQSLTFYMYAYFLIEHILNFIKYYGGFFFSIGVALRAFPPTRGGGAYLMAISFGLYFVLPFSYILVATTSLPAVQSGVLQPECSSLGTAPVSTMCSLPRVTDVKTYQCEGAAVSNAFKIPGRIRANLGAINDLLSGSRPRAFSFGQHLVSAICVLPLVAFVILMTFVLNATNLFGGNIPEIGRGLVKLI